MRTKQSNKQHHNYGRAQSPKTRFTAKINWFLLQVKGAHGNLMHSGRAITEDPMFRKLKLEYQERFHEAIATARNTASPLRDVAEEIASLNSPDKWVD